MLESTRAEKGKQINVKTHKNSMKVDCRWVIGLLFAEGLMFVTKADNHSKYFYWESGKEPLYFESKRTADYYAFGLGLNGYPDVFLVNPARLNIKKKDGE